MSLYNALFGVNPFCGTLLKILGISHNDVPRFRDCFLNEAGDEIIIHTRTGGGNRDYYDKPDPENDYNGPWNSDLRRIAGFKFDADDSFDATYANFHYKVPEAFKDIVLHLRELGAVSNPRERWQNLFDALQKKDPSNPDFQRAVEVGKEIMSKIDEAFKK